MDEQKKTLTVLDRSTKGFSKAVTDLTKIMGDLGGLSTSIATLTEEIEFKQSELNAIEEKTKTDIRLAKAELTLKVTENEAKVLADLIKKNNLATITTEELNELNCKLSEALVIDEEAITSKVKAAESALHAKYNSEIAGIRADYQVSVAQKDADIVALRMQVSYMEETISSLKATIEADREARVEIAKAESNKQGTIINTNSK